MKVTELKEKIKKMLDEAEDKTEALYQAADMIVSSKYEDLVDQITMESARAAHDADFREACGLRALNEEEEKFYNLLVDPENAVTLKQEDVFPTSIIERTMADLHASSDTLSLVKMAPAGVAKWLVGSHSGKAAWGALSDEITAEVTAGIDSMIVNAHKLSLFVVIPKAIRGLSLPFVDKYFRAVLAEGMKDGMIDGYLNGDGKNAPVGITKQIAKYTSTGTATAKVKTAVTGFSPLELADTRKTLTNNGKRAVTELHLICNPLDEAQYVDPALYGPAIGGGFEPKSFIKIVKHVEPCMTQGTGIFTIKDAYTMGATKIDIKEYKETKALEDADLLIGKCEANGRADDDNCAVVFDITALKPYTFPLPVAPAAAAQA